MTGIVRTLTTPDQIAHVLQQANAIANAVTLVVKPGQFVFFAAFDGTNNSSYPAFAGNTKLRRFASCSCR